MEKHDSCIGCKHYLGNGLCRINEEKECEAGGGYELWSAKECEYGDS